MTGEGSTDGSERPEGWPEMWLDSGPPCSHTLHWDDSDGGYVCLDCGEERDEPPERYITGSDQSIPPNHVLIEVPAGGKEPAKEVIEYRVGPACNYRFFRDWRNQQMLVLWGDSLSTDTLRRLGDACHELEQERAGMAMYDGASAADRMEGAFIFENRQERYLHTGSES